MRCDLETSREFPIDVFTVEESGKNNSIGIAKTPEAVVANANAVGVLIAFQFFQVGDIRKRFRGLDRLD